MANISPDRLVLRCYGYRIKGGKWFGLCLNFNLGVEATSVDELKRKMRIVVNSYIETVFDTNDKDSIAELFGRKAPLKDWAVYYWIGLRNFIKNLPGHFTFKEIVPFHLAHNC